jgi:hypothetical protein
LIHTSDIFEGFLDGVSGLALFLTRFNCSFIVTFTGYGKFNALEIPLEAVDENKSGCLIVRRGLPRY